MSTKDRIAVLEARLNRQRWWTLALALCCVGVFTAGMGHDGPKTMQLEKLEIMHNGKVAIGMGPDDKGDVGIAFMDPNTGKARIALGVNSKSEAGVVLMDKQEKTRIALGVDAKSEAGVVVMDKQEQLRIVLSDGAQGAGVQLDSLEIMHNGKVAIGMGPNDKGDLGIALMDPNTGKARIALGVDAKSEAGVVVMDKQEKPRILLGDGAQGAGVVLMGARMLELPVQ